MKEFISTALLIICVFMVLPMIVLIFEHLINDKDSILQKMLNNMTQ